ncbi:MAG: Zn-finger nucleic acid-binding protein [Parasphingorhabdus sp.]|jgi:Zn-finger nucleic acid-binding protein
MQCPKCDNISLKTAKVSKSNIELDSCPSCKGLWFDKNELTEILGKRAEKYFEIPKFAARNLKSKCPKCSGALYEFCYPDTLTLVDACINCSGIWLDDLEWKQISEQRNPAKQMTCPKCAKQQKQSSTCSNCGIIVGKYLGAEQVAKEPRNDTVSVASTNLKKSFNSANFRRAQSSSNVFKQLEFVRDELIEMPGINEMPSGGIGSFASRIGYALSLGFKEKEILVFGLLQWAAVALAYLLWVQMLDWIPEEVWRSAENSKSGSVADYVLAAWGILCIGLAAYPIGILTGCMGAAHFLHRQGQSSTVAKCLHLVLPRSWPLWIFHWVDGYITTRQILSRLPQKDDRRTAADKALSEALYYAWKIGVSGVLPSILTGYSLVRSGKNSVFFVKDNFMEVAKLRLGYSALCWIVGIGSYIGMIFLLMNVDILPDDDELYSHIYTLYLWAALPILVGLSFVMLLLRPIYVISICDLYSDYLERQGKKASMPEDLPKSISAFVAFLAVCIIVAAVFLFRDEMGISGMLATPYGQE